MTDFSMFQDVPGLLTPEQSSNVNSMALLNAGANLLKSGGTFRPYKGGFGADIGAGVQGLLGGYTQGTDQALKQQLLRQQIMQGQLGMAQTVAMYNALGLPLPTIPGMTASAPAGPSTPPMAPPTNATSGMVTQPPPAPPAGLMSPQPSAGPATDQGGDGVVVPTPDGSGFTRIPAPAQPSAAPAGLLTPASSASAPGSGVGTVRSLPAGDRALLAVGGPGAVAKVVGDLASKNAELTPDQKNARASGFRSPFDYTVGVDNAKATPEMKNAAASGAGGSPLQFEYDKAQVPVRVKQYGDIQDQGTKALDEKGDLNVVRQSLLDPSFYSGPGSEKMLVSKQLWGLFARNANGVTGAKPGDRSYMDPSTPVSNEQFSAASNQVLMSYLKSSFAGQRITNRDVALVEKIVPNADHSVEGNLVRTNIMDKLAQRKMDVADLASNYAKDHGGHLDAGWDSTLRQWWAKNPLFVDGELQAMKTDATQQIATARKQAQPAQPATFNNRFSGGAGPPVEGAKQAPDGNWYVQRGDKFFRVDTR